MSIKAMNWALNDVQCAPDLKVTLMAMADRADDNGACFPSQKELEHKTCIPLRTLKRKIKRLKELGVITVITRQVSANLRRNAYRLRIEQAFDLLEKRTVSAEKDGANLAPLPEVVDIEDGASVAPLNGADLAPSSEQWCHSYGPHNGATQVAHEPPYNHQVVSNSVVTTTEVHPVFETALMPTRSQVTMSDSWRPTPSVFERLKVIRGIDPEFSEDQLFGFTTYHANSTKRQGAFESAFIKHVIYNFENRKCHPTLLPADWTPDQVTIQRLLTQGVEVNFLWEQATEFAMYWHERGTAGYGWQAKFYARCLTAWQQRKPVAATQGTALDRINDRSWGDSLQLASGG